MKIAEYFSQVGLARQLLLPALKKFAFDFQMTHPWVPRLKIKLNSFLHKGYWFFRKGREYSTMELFSKLVPENASVVEVGGHIGFITTYFAKLVASDGRITVFEPGSNNLEYIRHNIASAGRMAELGRIELVEKAVGSKSGQVEFFEDSLTGQNNSVIANFKGLQDNATVAFTEAEIKKRTVELTSLDIHFGFGNVDFVKIDVEGFEYDVLLGMKKILKEQRPVVMVEVQASEDEIFDIFSANGYVMYDEDGHFIASRKKMSGNLFCLHSKNHRSQIERYFPSI